MAKASQSTPKAPERLIAARTAREEALRRIYELPYEDQVEVLRVLGSWVYATQDAENPVDRQSADRVDALDRLRQAAAWLKLPDGDTPTIAQYDQAREALGLDMSSQQIVRRWERWRTACSALTGERYVPRNAAWRGLRGVGAESRREYEDYVSALRDWQDRPDMDCRAAATRSGLGR